MPPCEEPPVINFKTGSTGNFKITYSYAVEDDMGEVSLVPQDISEYEIFVNFIDNLTGEIIAETSIGAGITLQEGVGEYVVEVGDTLDWPTGRMLVDILYMHVGRGRHTTDFILDITQGRTNPSN